MKESTVMLLEIVNPAILRKDTSERDKLIAKKEKLESEIKGLSSFLTYVAEEMHGSDTGPVDPLLLQQEDDASYLKSLAEVELVKTIADIASVDSSVKFTARTLVSCT